jgi:alanyl-tRNA synthetase
MTIKRYLESGTLFGSTIVTAIGTANGRAIRLHETWFHPQGGGQRGDRGRIGTAQVIDTRHAADGEVDHFIDTIAGLEVGQRVQVEVDAGNRRRSAQLHSGGHLIADAVQAIRPGLHAVAGHHWENEARVEFEGDLESSGQLVPELADCLAGLIAANLPIRIAGDPFSNRAIGIGDFKPVGCGGTHVESTAELAGLEIIGVRRKGDRLRVSYQIT